MTFPLKLIVFVLENKANTIQVNVTPKSLFSRLSLRAEYIIEEGERVEEGRKQRP